MARARPTINRFFGSDFRPERSVRDKYVCARAVAGCTGYIQRKGSFLLETIYDSPLQFRESCALNKRRARSYVYCARRPGDQCDNGAESGNFFRSAAAAAMGTVFLALFTRNCVAGFWRAVWTRMGMEPIRGVCV